MARPHGLLVERPEVLRGPAAARDDDRVEVLLAQPPQRVGDERRRTLALHARGRDDQARERPAPPEHVGHVVEHRSGWGGDESDPLRERRQRALALDGEQALGLELRAQPLELRCERADALRLHEVDDEREVAALLVERERAVDDDREALVDPLPLADVAAAEQHAAQRAASVAEREVDVPRGGPREVRDLARHPDVGEVAVGLDQLPQVAGDLVDRVDLGRHRARSGCGASGSRPARCTCRSTWRP